MVTTHRTSLRSIPSDDAGRRPALLAAAPSLLSRLEDEEVPAISPRALRVPPAILLALRGARRALVVGHVAPDGDAVGCALGVSRALTLLGTEVSVAFDDDLPRELARLDEAHGIARPEALERERFDLAVVVDVAQAERLGRAQALVSRAERVVVIDHHAAPATHRSLALPSTCPLFTWVDAGREAAAMLVAAVVMRLVEGRAQKEWASLTRPLLAGMLTDTSGFTQPGSTKLGFGLFKYLLRAYHGGALEPLLEDLVVELPAKVRRLLSIDISGSALFASRLGELSLFTCPRAVFEQALSLAKAVDQSLNGHDVRGFLMQELDAQVNERTVVALALETPEGTQLSVRSKEPGMALKIACALGGGGHARKAAATWCGSRESLHAGLARVMAAGVPA